DFFINSVWGREGIDLQFLPSQQVKEKLARKYQIANHKMFVTGIPVHEEITKTVHPRKHNDRLKILLSGGNSGLGGIIKLADELKHSSSVDFLVLCGNNKKLYDDIDSWNLEHIKPLAYLSSRSEMNKLYEEVDAIVSKPGGVTISEAIRKRLPIFVHAALPGQEKINLRYLKKQELVFELDQKTSLEKQLLSVLMDQKKMKGWNEAITAYQQGLELEKLEMVDLIKIILDQKTSSRQSSFTKQSEIFHVARA
ncbi:MAG: glycosyltransferase, partial [Bacillus sp. (in: firmicutes)]